MRIYLMDPSRGERLEPFKRRVDEILANPISENFTFSQDPQTPGVRSTDRWTWIDALYMGPPALALLAQATGDERYLKLVDREFKPVYDTLYDPQEKLFYRDDRFINQSTANGQKIFWSRSNGWVFARLPLLLDPMPADYQNRDFFTNLFKDMAPAILAAQQPDGLWYPNLKDRSRSRSERRAEAPCSSSAWHGASATDFSTAPPTGRPWSGDGTAY